MVNVKITFLTEEASFGHGIITDAPSVEAVREKIESAGALVISAEEATEEEVAEARAQQEEE